MEISKSHYRWWVKPPGEEIERQIEEVMHALED